MANSIYPDESSAGGLVVRDAAGNPVAQPSVHNAYVPLPLFIATCPITALPSDCTARIEPRQINAIVSELLSFAECLDPDGPWDCNSLQNLCAAFKAWIAANPIAGVIIQDDPPVAQHGQLWWESDTGDLYLMYDDGNSQQFVQVNGQPAFDRISIIGSGTATDPHSVGLVDCGVW